MFPKPEPTLKKPVFMFWKPDTPPPNIASLVLLKPDTLSPVFPKPDWVAPAGVSALPTVVLKSPELRKPVLTLPALPPPVLRSPELKNPVFPPMNVAEPPELKKPVLL